MLENAMRICEANFGNLLLVRRMMRSDAVAVHDAPQAMPTARTAARSDDCPASHRHGRLIALPTRSRLFISTICADHGY